MEAGGRIYSMGICGSLVKTKAMPKACLGDRTFLCSAPLQVDAGAAAVGRDLGMFARPRQFKGELYLSSDGGNQPRGEDNQDDLCAAARVIFKCDHQAGLFLGVCVLSSSPSSSSSSPPPLLLLLFRRRLLHLLPRC